MENLGENLVSALSGTALIQAPGNGVATERGTTAVAHQSGLELFHSALSPQSDDAWGLLVERFQGLVLTWVRNHARREQACQYHDPTYYAALAFERVYRGAGPG